MSISDNLDRETTTFSADRVFCDRLFGSRNAEPAAELLAYYAWARVFIPHFQQGFFELARLRFDQGRDATAIFRTAALLTGILNDTRLVPYLVVRGIVGEAGSVLRRALEHMGVLAHFWADPSKLEFLKEIDGKAYRNAFLSERNKSAQEELTARGVKKRFACLCLAEPVSRLYELLSNHYVHGGSSAFLVHSSLDPNQFSCWFHNRRDPEELDIDLLARGVELLCQEIVHLYDHYANEYQTYCPGAVVGGEKLDELCTFPDPPSAEKRRQIGLILGGLRNRNIGKETASQNFYEWLFDKGIPNKEVRPETVLQFFRDSGIVVTDDGIPLIPGVGGPAQHCSRCGTWTECGTSGTRNSEPVVLCQDCWRLMFTDTDRFHAEGWGKSRSANDDRAEPGRDCP
jgi:hypothetical protein